MNQQLRPIARSQPGDPFIQYAVDLDRPDAPIFREEGGFSAGGGHLPLQKAVDLRYELKQLDAEWLVELAHRERLRTTPFSPTEILSTWTYRLSKNASKQRAKTASRPLDAEFVASLAARWISAAEAAYMENRLIKLELEADERLMGIEIDRNRKRIRRTLEEAMLTELPFGTSGTVPIITADGVRVPDAAWSMDPTYPWSFAPCPRFRSPDIWIDIVMDEPLLPRTKQRHTGLFLAGALECWICGPSGSMSFHSPDGPLWQSRICPLFPLELS